MKLNDIHLGCHGIPERCFKIKGKHMAFCSRCLGASIGHLGAAASFFIGGMLPIYFFPIGLGIMLGDWYLQNKYKLYHSNVSRLGTGIIGGYSVGLVIWWLIEFCYRAILLTL